MDSREGPELCCVSQGVQLPLSSVNTEMEEAVWRCQLLQDEVQAFASLSCTYDVWTIEIHGRSVIKRGEAVNRSNLFRMYLSEKRALKMVCALISLHLKFTSSLST